MGYVDILILKYFNNINIAHTCCIMITLHRYTMSEDFFAVSKVFFVKYDMSFYIMYI
jgi:hypothetical protein